MKIILLGTAHPYRGGLATFNERLARQFVLEGHDVELWTFTLQYPAFLFPGKTLSTPSGVCIDPFIAIIMSAGRLMPFVFLIKTR